MLNQLMRSAVLTLSAAGIALAAPPQIVHDNTGETFPFGGYIDPRSESSDGGAVDLGLTRVTITFDQPVQAIGGGAVQVAYGEYVSSPSSGLNVWPHRLASPWLAAP